MKINVVIKITPSPDKEGKELPEESCSINMEMSKGFGDMFPGEGIAEIAKGYVKDKLNSEPIDFGRPIRPATFYQPDFLREEDEYISPEELEEFRKWKKLKMTE
jgi:hypothetical protein